MPKVCYFGLPPKHFYGAALDKWNQTREEIAVMKIIVIAVFAGLVFADLSLAKIGETKNQLIVRYGKPLSESDEEVVFSKAGYDIIAILFNEKCGCITFDKTENAPNNRAPLAGGEIKALLSANGAKWKMTDKSELDTIIFFNEDDELIATYSADTCTLTIAAIAQVAEVAKNDKIPYDRLSSENVTVEAKSVAGGASTRNDFKTDYGSHDKTKQQAKDIEVTVHPIFKNKEDLTIMFYFVLRSKETKSESFAPSEPIIFKDGGGKTSFRGSATSTDTKYAALGVREKTGETICGWLVRVVRGNKIVGVEGSNERFKNMAGDPKSFPE
jgi:hypothetical protein